MRFEEKGADNLIHHTVAGQAREELANALARTSNGRGLSMMEARGMAGNVIDKIARALVDDDAFLFSLAGRLQRDSMRRAKRSHLRRGQRE